MRVSWKTRLIAAIPRPLRPWWDRLEQSPWGTRLARGAFWSVTGGVVARGLSLLASILVARILGKDVFGELGTVQSTIGMFTVFAGLGMGLTATKHVAEFRLKDPARAGRIITLSNRIAFWASIVVALAMFASASGLAAAVAAPHIAPALRIAALSLFLHGISGAQTGALAGLEAFRTIAGLNFITGVVSFPLLVAGALWRGIEGSIWALSATAAVGYVANHFALRRELTRAGIPRREPWRRADLPLLWSFALPSGLAMLMVGPVHWACCAILMNQPGGSGEMGAFNAANQWYTALMFLPALLGQSVLPMMAEQLGAAGKRQSLQLLRLSMKLNACTALPVVFLCLASPWIMALFGPTFAHEWPALVAVLVTAALVAVQIPVGQMIIASGNIWPGFWMNVGWAIVCLAGSWALAGWGALGLASARLIAYTAHAVWTIWYAFRLLRTESP